MSITPTTAVSETKLAAFHTASDTPVQRAVSDAEASAFAESVNSKKVTTQDVLEAITLGVVNNIMTEQAEKRTELAAVIEGRDP